MLFFVPTPIGNLADITLHTLEVFNRCAIVICEDTRITKKLLSLLLHNPLIQQYYPNIAPHKKRFMSFHSHNQEQFLSHLTSDFFTCDIVFCTDAGMPNISDPGALLLRYAREHSIAYEIVLGGSAFSHAFVHSGLEGGFFFSGFLPHKQHERQMHLKNLLEYHATMHLIIYESPKRLRESLQDIDSIMPHAIIFLYKELTKLYETEIIGNAQTILAQLPPHIKGEYCMVIEKNCKDNALLHSIEAQQILKLTQEDILTLDIHPKQKAKMLAKISTKSVKEWYMLLMNDRRE